MLFSGQIKPLTGGNSRTLLTAEIIRFVLVVVRLTGRTLSNAYGPGTGQIWLDDLQCTGSESYIGNCNHDGWGSHNCDHSEDVSIKCYSGSPDGQ